MLVAHVWSPSGVKWRRRGENLRDLVRGGNNKLREHGGYGCENPASVNQDLNGYQIQRVCLTRQDQSLVSGSTKVWLPNF